MPALPPGASGHETTYYSLTASALAYFQPAQGSSACDVCVVGGGLAGLTVALELARRGKAVTVLESRRFGWSASGRNGGFVSPGYALSVASLEEQLGLDHARQLFRLSLDGVAYVRRQVRDAPQPSKIFSGQGSLKLIRHGDVAGLERSVERMAQDYHYPQTFQSRRELLSHVTTPRYRAGILDMSAFQIHPLEYASLLVGLCRQAGASLNENSHVVSLQRTASGGWRVKTTDAVIDAGEIVLATSAHNGPSHRVNGAVLPVSTYVVTAASELLGSAIRFSGALGDTRRASDYYRIVQSHCGPLLLWGGRITTRLSRPAALQAMIRNDILSVYPQLDDLKITNAWTGVMGYARHKMPLIGRVEKGAWVMTAFGGHGLNTSAMAGILVAAAICDGDDRYRLFSRFPVVWAGGMAGRMAVQAEYWRLAILDRFQEARAAAGL